MHRFNMRCSFFCALVLSLFGCGDGTNTPIVDTPDPIITAAQVRSQLDALPTANTELSALQVELGRLLFWDPVLSVAQDTACASCHHPDFDYADGLFASLGTGASGLGPERQGGARTTRNSPTVVNTVFNGVTIESDAVQSEAPMFWDNRHQSLEAQAEQPLTSAVEMRGETIAEADVMPLLLQRLNTIPEYRVLFADAFNQDEVNAINRERLLSALAIFQRSLVSNNSAFDQFMRGDQTALNTLQQRGLKNFIDIGCVACHSGPMFSDYQLHVLGTADNINNPNGVDSGADQSFSFRTPSLRNLANTAPYTHSGSRETLRDVLSFYVALSRGVSHNSQVAPADIATQARALGRVDSATESLLAFLDALNDADFDREIPAVVPSGLPVGGNILEQ